MTNKKFTATTVINYSPRKSRLITNSLKRLPLNKALNQLILMKKGKTKKFYNLLKSAANNLELSEEEFSKYYIKTFIAEEAQKYYRIVPRARGSAFRIRRRYSRLKVQLSPLENNYSD